MSSPTRRSCGRRSGACCTSFYLSPGFLSEKVTIFEATGLSPAGRERDDDEEIEGVRLDLAEIDTALPEIRDATTVIALLRLKEKL